MRQGQTLSLSYLHYSDVTFSSLTPCSQSQLWECWASVVFSGHQSKT